MLSRTCFSRNMGFTFLIAIMGIVSMGVPNPVIAAPPPSASLGSLTPDSVVEDGTLVQKMEKTGAMMRKEVRQNMNTNGSQKVDAIAAKMVKGLDLKMKESALLQDQEASATKPTCVCAVVLGRSCLDSENWSCSTGTILTSHLGTTYQYFTDGGGDNTALCNKVKAEQCTQCPDRILRAQSGGGDDESSATWVSDCS